MAATPRPGQVYLNPTTAASGGTPLVGIAEDLITFDPRRETLHFGSGLQADAFVSVAAPSRTPAVLAIDVRDVSAQTMQLLMSLVSTESAMHSSGGQSTAQHGTPSGVALVIRPRDGGVHLYGPRWKQHPEGKALITWSRKEMRYVGNTLLLMPQRSLDGTKRAFMEDTPSAIDTYYGLGT